ncbi:response regulator [Brevibacillus sp. AY1]|uniref:response regulator n=1 Tax=Brevibacillus sp. AY1 TaxID=2807621 RepID=UPI002456E89E|nr:response regulator [Brevibacillus sp. AY1]MDH4620206.1 response regulator [Brevibacillus sp. AY1]
MNRIMIVDDAAFMRTMLKDSITKAGYEVVGEGKDGEEAVKLYKQLRPDLVTMDITMPGMDGIAAVKEIRAFDPKAKVIMCSAMGQQAMVVEALKAGAKDFLVKPFIYDRVKDSIEKVLGL